MCVICVKMAGKSLPTKRELKDMYKQNHDGCGFVCKSFSYHSMDFEDFYDKLKQVPKGEACIIHFRWATHGSARLGNCHPFYDESTGVWFAHNGILDIEPKGDTTDSETAFRDELVPVIRRFGFASGNLAAAVCQIIGGSRFAFMKDGNIRLFGHFYKHGDCYYSNLRHIRTPFYWRAS